MIVLHDFFYKSSHPRYLDKAVGMMRGVNGCGFFNHKDFETFIDLLREELKESTGGRYDKGEISLARTNGQVQIEVKGGLDYAARIDYTVVEKVFTYKAFSRERVQGWKLTPEGEIKFLLWKEDEV